MVAPRGSFVVFLALAACAFDAGGIGGDGPLGGDAALGDSIADDRHDAAAIGLRAEASDVAIYRLGGPP